MRKILLIIGCFVCLSAWADGGDINRQTESAKADVARQKGDMDGDGRLSLKDLTMIVKYMLDCQTGWGTTQIALQLRQFADVDGSGSVTVADVEALRAILLAQKRDGENNDGDDTNEQETVHEAVDLGLSVRWATMNVGAKSVTDSGDYFAWGETEPKASYTEENYLYYVDGEYQSIGNDIGGGRYDAATAQWGDGWRMPTLIDINQLKNRCTWELITLNGVSVYRVTGPNGNSIYMPLSGYRMGDDTLYVGSELYCWCSMKPSTASAAYCLFSQNYTGNWSANRSYGFTIRAVKN